MEAKLLRHLIRSKAAPSRANRSSKMSGAYTKTPTRAPSTIHVRLRRYIEEDPSKPKHLLTVRGVGYRFHRLNSARRLTFPHACAHYSGLHSVAPASRRLV